MQPRSIGRRARGLIGGFVGFVGYECKADCGSPNIHRSDVPDAVLMLANRLVAVDHVARRTDVIALCGEDTREADDWLDEAERAVRELLLAAPQRTATDAEWVDRPAPTRCRGGDAARVERPVKFSCGRGREQYLADIARCQAALAAGESYEVCLTDQISTSASPEPWALYRLLRRTNPAPFAAYLRLGELTVSAPRPSASSRSIASAAWRRGRSRGRRAARPIRSRTPRCAQS